LISLDLSEYHAFLKIKEEDDKHLLFDPVRKSYFLVQPEELVRQSWIHFLRQENNVSFSNLSVEKQIIVGQQKKRFDLVLYQKAEPHVLFEFKSFNIQINEDTCMQVANYNIELKVPFIVISNGIEHFAYRVNFEEKVVEPLHNLSFLKL